MLLLAGRAIATAAGEERLERPTARLEKKRFMNDLRGVGASTPSGGEAKTGTDEDAAVVGEGGTAIRTARGAAAGWWDADEAGVVREEECGVSPSGIYYEHFVNSDAEMLV
jgi:hypothetical protein